MDTSLAGALARIAELNRELGRNPEQDPILRAHRFRPGADSIDSLAGAASALTDHLRNIHAVILGKEKSVEERVQRYERMRDRAAKEGNHVEAADWQETIDHYRANSDGRIPAHREAIETKLARLREAPDTMFLPLGTVVRFTDADTYPICTNLGAGPGRLYPVAGSIGVVTGLSRGSEYPISVSMRRTFTDGWDDQVHPDFDRMPRFFVDPGKVEVVALGLLPDGSPSEAYGYQPTHRRVDDDQDEMIVEADGFFWRFQTINGVTECGQAFETMAEMSWVGDPIAEQAPSNPIP